MTVVSMSWVLSAGELGKALRGGVAGIGAGMTRVSEQAILRQRRALEATC